MMTFAGTRFWRRFRHERAALIAAGFLLALVFIAILSPALAPYDPLDQDLSATLQGPTSAHWLGTDHLGRDLLSRLIVASRISLRASLQAAGVAIVVGVPLGLTAGYLGGWWDRTIMRATDIVMALPGIVLVIALLAVFGNNLSNAMIALGLVFAPPLLRLTRGSVLSVREAQYIDAVHVLGLPRIRIMLRHVLPNAAPPIIVQVVLTLGTALLVEAGLAFLGLGVQPPYASWGKMLTEASTYAAHQPFSVFPPGIVITLTVLAFNFLGDGLRDSFGRGVQQLHRLARLGAQLVTFRRPHTDVHHYMERPHLLRLEDVSVAFPDPDGKLVPVAQNIDLSIARGEVVGLVGESGSGKTMTALSIVGLVPQPGVVTGSVVFEGRDLTRLSQKQLSNVRGNDIAMVFQDPVASLDPVFTVGHQIAEPLRRHLGLSRAQARKRAIALLDRVGVPHASRRIDDYPHQFSGGMAQRVMIAAALSCNPKLLIADEPTTALDVTTQAEVLELLRELQADFQMAVLIITHDLGVIADICDRAIVMYAGQIVEAGPLRALFNRPTHPYTEALLLAAPRAAANADSDRLAVIPGSIPQPGTWPSGCRFHPRCRYAIEACAAADPDLTSSGAVTVRCIRAHELTLTPGG